MLSQIVNSALVSSYLVKESFVWEHGIVVYVPLVGKVRKRH